ncbi:hypothetical protein Tco_1247515 [Tanacetum coccineum]
MLVAAHGGCDSRVVAATRRSGAWGGGVPAVAWCGEDGLVEVVRQRGLRWWCDDGVVVGSVAMVIVGWRWHGSGGRVVVVTARGGEWCRGSDRSGC